MCLLHLMGDPISQIRCKFTTIIWNIQGFDDKKLNLFIFFTGNHCYSLN